MDQALLVGMLQTQSGLVDEVGGQRGRDRALFAENRGQAHALDILHDQKVAALILAAIERLDDVRVRELGERAAPRAESG